MKKYTVTAVLGLAAGTVVGLTHDQAEARVHALKPIKVDAKAKTGTYEVISRIEFKKGEVIFTDADLNKALAASLESEEVTRQKGKDKAKAAEEAKDIEQLKAKARALDEMVAEFQRLGIESHEALQDLVAKAKAWDDIQEELVHLRAAAVPQAGTAGAPEDGKRR